MSEERPKVEEKVRESKSNAGGLMQGLPPGRRVNAVSVLDLRGVPAEQVAQMESANAVRVILLDEDNRLALDAVSLNAVGAVVVAHPEERVIVAPQLDLSNASVAGMPNAQKLLVVGNLFFKPDVSAGLVGEKIESLRVVGVMIACEGVYGVLVGRLQLGSGATLALPDNAANLVRALGETRIDRHYLQQLPEGTTYVNVGSTEFTEDVSAELIQQKIAVYYNMGETEGPETVISVIQARCPTNLGQFNRL